MTFKTRTIRPKSKIKPSKNPTSDISPLKTKEKKSRSFLNYFVSIGLAIFGLFVVFKVTLAAYNFVSEIKAADVLEVLGSDLKKDQNGYTNILLLGDGGYERQGPGLVDTIMVASIDFKKESVSLFSIPRDFYVGKNFNLGLNEYGKINEVYVNNKDLPDNGGYQVFKDAVGNLVNLDIQYFMRIDFNGFVEVVDSLGGITVDVPKAINDSTYPAANDIDYDPFYLEAGVQQLDGETALKYARSRHGTGDIDRAARQQVVLEAIRQKALSADILTSPSSLKDIYEAINDNFTTDLTLREMASLGAFAQEMQRSRLVRKQLGNNPLADGGFVYDGSRALYGAAVMIPLGEDLDLIHQYTDLVFNHREIYYEPAKIEILNATKVSGVAGGIAEDLKRFGFQVEEIGNYTDDAGEKITSPTSFIEYSDWTEKPNGQIVVKYQPTLDVLTSFVKAPFKKSSQSHLLPPPPAPENEDEEPEEEEKQADKVYEGGAVNIRIILGEDYQQILAN